MTSQGRAIENLGKTATGGHVARPMPARFINRLPSDYLSRYGLVLAQENEAFAWRNYYYSLTSMEITKLGQKWAQISSIFVVRAACARRIDGSDGTAQITFFLSTFLTLTGVFFAPLSSSLASRWPQAEQMVACPEIIFPPAGQAVSDSPSESAVSPAVDSS